MWNDLRYALRLLASRPAFSAAAVFTLALGLGANTAMFSVVRAALLRPLPYAEPGELVKVTAFDRAAGQRGNLSPGDFFDFERETRAFSRMGAHGSIAAVTMTSPIGEAQRVGAVSVTDGFFPTLGTAFAFGRSFTHDEDHPGAEGTVILSYPFWNRQYGGDPSVIGSRVSINLQPFTVIGVLAPGFRHVEMNPERDADVFLPYAFDRIAPNRGGHFIRAVARLAPGATLESARLELVGIAERLERDYPRDNTNRSVIVLSLGDAIVENARPGLLMLAAAVVFVLLVACANLTNLLLAQSASRRGEIALRAALGADRVRLARQLVVESLTLAALGGAAGVALAWLSTRWLTALRAAGVPGASDIRLDSSVLVFSVSATVATGLVVGLVPALQLARADVHGALGRSARGQSRLALRRRARELLVASQMALALALLTGAGLMLRSLWQLQQVDTGFASDHALTFETAVPTAKYAEGEQIQFYRTFYDRVRALPGVTAVGATNILPLSANYDSRGIQIEASPVPPAQAPSVQARSVSLEYFTAMRIPLIAGRVFTEQDREGAPLVVIVNAAMARKFWPGVNAVGQRITFNNGVAPSAQRDVGGPGSREVVGVVGDVKHLDLDEADVSMFYTPQAQQPSYHTMTIVVRTKVDPAELTPALRRELAMLDPAVPLARVRTLDSIVRASSAAPRMQAWLLGLFAALALLLAAIGVYGVVSYLVGERTREIAVRLALGARQQAVLGAMIWEGLRPVTIGLGVGLIAAFGAARLIAGMLYQVSPNDASTYAAVLALLAAVACVAIWIPARRAARVEPMAALRAD